MKSLLEKIKDIPKNPGVYQFLDKNGGVLYVGKAKDLRSRIRQYFGKDGRPQIPFLMAEAADFRYTVVHNDLESAFLENTVIKQYSPRYNIDLKDDKNYAFITIDYSFEIPQIGYSRKIADVPRRHAERSEASQNRDSSTARGDLRMTPRIKYFGPYSAAYKIKNILNLIRKIFPFCANNKVSNRPCFYYYMHRCPGVCVGKITLDEYRQQLDKIIKFLSGDITSVVKEIKTEMVLASRQKRYETASRLRDQLQSLEILQQKQHVILPKRIDFDVVSQTRSDGYACINLFKIREGKMFDKENFVLELPPADPSRLNENGITRVETDGIEPHVLQSFLERYYLEASSFGKCVYTEISAKDPKLVEQIIFERFKRKAEICMPKKGQILKLINLGKLNAEEHLKNWLASQAGHLDKINQALEQLKAVLALPTIPKRIECYDISNIQGSNPVGSMVVFKDGLPAKSEYRKFKIQTKSTPDDFAMMKEMLARRLARLDSAPTRLDSRQARQVHRPAQTPINGRATSDKWPLPDLMVIDGGKGQLSAALEVITDIPVIGLAKRIEEIFLPNEPNPIVLSHDQPALQLLQRLRDEAHRFGITFHRQLRSKQAVRSALDEIPGVGPKTKKLLKQKFGTVAKIKKASLDQLAEVIGQKLAATLKNSL